MRVFETGINGHHKLNFVDDNNIFVCFDYYVNCCEIFDYKITESEPQTYEHLEKVPANNVYDFPGYNFDVSYKQELFEADGGEGGAIVFRTVNEKLEPLYIVLMNSHNGFYSHGFEMRSENNVIHRGEL